MLKKLLIAGRFILFGVGGFIAAMVAIVICIDQVSTIHAVDLRIVLLMLLAVAGGLAMLFGVGEWGRWAYLWVFLSIPASCCLFFLPPLEHSDKMTGMMIPAVAGVSTYLCVRIYYARKQNQLEGPPGDQSKPGRETGDDGDDRHCLCAVSGVVKNEDSKDSV